MELMPQFQRDPTALRLLYVRSNTGKLVPLDSVTTPRNIVGPLTVTHMGQTPSVSFSFDLAPGVSLGEATALIEESATQNLPASIRTAFPASAARFQHAFLGSGCLLL